MPTIFLGLGSNIDPEGNLKRCAMMLRKEFGDVRFSRVFRSAPRDAKDQPDFLNAVARIGTTIKLEEAFKKTQAIEVALGKSVPYPKGPRTMDIDILLYEVGKLQSWEVGELIIPHPRMHQRRFVLDPLCELLDPKETHPILKKSWATLLRENLDQQCEKMPIVL